MTTWSIPLEQMAAKANLDLETVARKSTLDLFRAVVLGSPVDLGQLRANMNVSYGTPDPTITSSTNAARAEEELAKVLTLPVGGVMYITNALPQAPVIEYGGYPNPAKRGSKKRGETKYTIHTVGGFSMQAPQGMFRLAATRYNEYVQRAFK